MLENRIKEIRKQRGLNRHEFAKLAGVPVSTLQKVEDGWIKRTSVGFANKVAGAFGLAINDVFFAENYPKLDITSVPDSETTDPETATNLETAKREHQILVMTAAEDALPELEQTALERLAERVRVYGKRNHYGHKQLGSIINDNGVLREVFEDSDPETITEARAKQILEDS